MPVGQFNASPELAVGSSPQHAVGVSEFPPHYRCPQMSLLAEGRHTRLWRTQAVRVKREASGTPDLRASSSPASHLGASAQSETSRAAAPSPSGCRAESVPDARASRHAAAAASLPQVGNPSGLYNLQLAGRGKLRARLLMCLASYMGMQVLWPEVMRMLTQCCTAMKVLCAPSQAPRCCIQFEQARMA